MCQGFGGVAGGYATLKKLHEDIDIVMKPLIGKPMTITAIVDLMNFIGRCVPCLHARVRVCAFAPTVHREYVSPPAGVSCVAPLAARLRSRSVTLTPPSTSTSRITP